MKAILDPFVFWLPPNAQINQKYIGDILTSIDFVISVSRHRSVAIATTDAIWKRIIRDLVRPLSNHIAPRLLQPRISALRNILTLVEPPPIVTGETWGMKQLFTFDNLPDSDNWMTPLARLAAYWINNNEEVVFLTRLWEGRNLVKHSAGHCVIWEKTHWKVYIQANAVNGTVGITCISSLRNLDVPWTTRYDDRLPDKAPDEGLPFVPPATWDRPTTHAVRTIRSKPAWVDKMGNGWADTNTPGIAHHWDVFLNHTDLKSKFGDDHVNITCWGTEDRGRIQGSIHH